MKIAILGKGGTGKSTVSWLLSSHLASNKKNNILAIDADHNMDLTSSLGIEITETDKFFHKSNKTFKDLMQIPEGQRWQFQFEPEYEGPYWIKFNYKPASDFLSKYIFKLRPNLDLLVTGLGEEDIMYTGMCSHGLSSPFKYLIPRLEMNENCFLVMDSVAGTDMVNYGLYFGFDVVIIVVEGHINSIKVARQLDQVLEKQGTKAYFILNKFNSKNEQITNFISENTVKNRILGEIPIDNEIMNYNYKKISSKTKENLDLILNKIKALPKVSTGGLELLKQFEAKKTLQRLSKI